MATKQQIEQFFEEQFNDTSQFFLYKDKKLLNEGKYREYAEEQISKANKAFWSIGFTMFFALWYGTTSFINYGNDPSWLSLGIGLFFWFGAMGAIWYASKEYYTIKSSMNMLIRLIDDNE